MTDTRPVVLKAEHLGITFGGLKAVSDFNMEIHEGELMGLIGPNGAGKTTVFNLLTGVYVPTEGAFYLCGQKLNGKQTYQVVEAGIARTFQNIRLFKAMTVLDNVKIAFTKDIHYNLADSLLRTKKYWNTEQELTDKAMEYLRIVHLDDKAGQLASSLPYGHTRHRREIQPVLHKCIQHTGRVQPTQRAALQQQDRIFRYRDFAHKIHLIFSILPY